MKRPKLNTYMKQINDVARIIWRLFQDFYRPPRTASRRGGKREQEAVPNLLSIFSHKKDYIVYNDRNDENVYCNNLAGTLKETVIQPCLLLINLFYVLIISGDRLKRNP